MFKLIDPETAAELIPDGATVAIGGGGAGHAVPDLIMKAIGKRFVTSAQPKQIDVIHPCGLGDNDKRGLQHFAHEGLVRSAVGGFWGNAPKMVALAKANKLTGHNLPQGVLSQLMRACASGKPGLVTKVGLHTFVDPRLEGGKINHITTEDLVHNINIKGEEYLFYDAHKIEISIIRGTSVDKEGNLTMEEEVGFFAMMSLAQAAKVNGGIVICQVKNINNNHADPGSVKVPGVLIDYVVQDPDQEMTFISKFDPALVKRDAPFENDELQLEGVKKIVSRRAARELQRGAFVNLGYGMADGVPIVAQQENFDKDLVFMIEQGSTGGIPTTGLNFGAMYNPSVIVDDGYQFDYFHGGGLDIAFLGFAQIDQHGNVNSSRFGKFLTGCGGFIDISQNAKKVVFCGTFAVKADIGVTDSALKINHSGQFKKFIDAVEQVTFSAKYALEKGQEVLYVTERAVFKLVTGGLELIEIAPGVDLQNDILDMMDFQPRVSDQLKPFDNEVFAGEVIRKETKERSNG